MANIGWLNNQNANYYALVNQRIENLASAPANPVEGQVYFNTTTDKFGVWDGVAWQYMGTSEAAGDVTGPASSVDNEVTLFSGTTGKSLKRATATGIPELTSGVLGIAGNSAVLSGTTASFTTADETKLDGVQAGATANDTDANLRDRTTHTGTQAASTISDFSSAADARIGAAAGVSLATLSSGKVPTSQLPAVSLTSVQTAASEAAMLALTTQEGDVVVRTDTNQTYMRNAGVAGTAADFTLLNTPTDLVTSVNGQTGVVVLAKSDVGLGNVTNDAQLKAASNLSDVADSPTAFTNIKQAATETATGVVELATVTEAAAKTDTSRAVTPAGLASFARLATGTIGNGALTVVPFTHNLGNQFVTAQLYDAATNSLVMTDTVLTDANTVTFTFGTAPAANAYRVVVTG